jgi:mRNA-degrading endonuclease toxin of MazEF toxin-antitoxin module
MKRGEIWLVSLDPKSGHEQKGRAVPLTGTGTKTTGIVRCNQPRALDLAARGGRKLESIPHAVMDQVLARISPISE